MTTRRRGKKQTGLRMKADGKYGWERLAFFGRDHGKQSFWDVPMTGGFFGGIEVGKAMAVMYLKHIRRHRDDKIHDASGVLVSILTAMSNKQPSNEMEADSLRGQRAGFMSVVCVWLRASAERLGTSLDGVTEDSLIEQANESLVRSDAALMAAIAGK